MLLENILVCIKGQIHMTFIVPLGEGDGTFQSFPKTLRPCPQPTMGLHFTQALEGRGASAGHSGIPIGTWRVAGVTEEEGTGEDNGDV